MSILAQSIYNSTGFTIGRRDSWTERTNQTQSSKKLNYDGDGFKMLVAELLCWRLLSVMIVIFQCIESVTKISNLSTAHFFSNIECPGNGW